MRPLPAGAHPRVSVAGTRAKRIVLHVGLALLALALAVVTLAVVAYCFGGMERPDPAMRRAFEALVAQGKAEPVRSRGLVIPIPGCRCHSEDPVQTIQHSTYRIRECRACHAGR